ncbi:MAG: DUF885 family protein [Acidimicrobiales bacterium]
MEARTDLRKRTLSQLASLNGEVGVNPLAKAQLTEWVSTEHQLMDSGEQWRFFHSMRSPRHRLSRVLWAAFLETPVEWAYVVSVLDPIGNGCRPQIEPLSEGLARGILAGASEARCLLQECTQLVVSDDEALSCLMIGNVDVAPDHVADLTAALRSLRASAGELAVFLSTKYLPYASTEAGVGEERYAVWSAHEFGEGFDLVGVYESCWDEIRGLDRELASVANSILPGSSAQEVVAMFNSDPAAKLSVGEGLRSWLEAKSREVAEMLDGSFVGIPEHYRSVRFVVDGVQSPATVSVLPGAVDRSRSGSFHIRAADGVQVPIWSLQSLVHGFVFPGQHLLNCYLCDSESSVQTFQRVLASQCSRGGWIVHSMSLVSDLARDQDDLSLLLSALYSRRRQLIRAGCDIGYHLGLQVPTSAPAMHGAQWTDDLVQYAFCEWGYLVDELAATETRRLVTNPAHGVAGVVGGRLHEASMRAARRNWGRPFDFQAYYERAISVTPMSAQGLEAQLFDIANDPRM